MLKRKNFKILFLLLSFINIIIWFNYFYSFEKNLSIHFVDVGTGDGVFIRTPEGFNIVIDGGPKNNFSEYLGLNFPFINKNIDLLILSHPHEDHVKGSLDILKNYKVNKILSTGIFSESPSYNKFLELARNKKIDFITAKQGQIFKFGDLKINVLFPFEYINNEKFSNINNSSIMFKVVYNNFSCLFLGDLEKDKADEILFSGVDIKSDIIKVSHQGSKNGIQNISKFLEISSPKKAIISVGKNNYGHPDKETLDKLSYFNIDILRTDVNKDIIIKSDGYNYWVGD